MSDGLIGKLVLLTIVTMSLAGCISSTTTGATATTDPDDNEAAQQYYQLGARYYRNGSYELARERLERAIEFSPRMAIAHSTLALTYERLENPRLATQHYELAVKYEPGNFEVRNAYAVYLCRQANYDGAQQQFDRLAKEKTYDNAEIMLTNAGVCMSQRPDYEKAEEYFREAIRRKPSYGEPMLQLSVLKHRVGDDLRARAFLQRYLESNEASPPVLLLGCQIEEAQGDARAAAFYSNQLFQDFPESAEARSVELAGCSGTASR